MDNHAVLKSAYQYWYAFRLVMQFWQVIQLNLYSYCWTGGQPSKRTNCWRQVEHLEDNWVIISNCEFQQQTWMLSAADAVVSNEGCRHQQKLSSVTEAGSPATVAVIGD
jgi:hypothetical protein